MPPIIGLILVVAGLGVAYVLTQTFLSTQRDGWSRSVRGVAERFGLEVHHDYQDNASATGSAEFGALSVSMSEVGRDSYTEVFCVVRGLDPGVTFEHEGLSAGLRKVALGNDVQVGHREFDKAVYVRGSSEFIVPLLNAEARAALMDELGGAGNLKVSDGRVSLRVRSLATQEDKLAQLVERVQRVAKSLYGGEATLAQRLLAIVQRDPDIAVRRVAAARLLDTWQTTDEAQQAATVAMASGDPELVVIGGAHTPGPEGLTALLGVALNGNAPPEQQVAALTAIARRPDREGVAEDVVGAVPRMSGARLIAALDMLAATSTVPPLRMLEIRYNQVELEARRALVVACERHGDAAAPTLSKFLADEADQVVAAAADALGRVGTLDDVMALREVEEGRSSWAGQKAAREAIASIQQRHGAGQAGQLAIAALSDAGSVALVEHAAAGEVALVEEQPG